MEFRVTFQLMIEPSKGDHTFNKSYTVDAVDEKEAREKAEMAKDAEIDEYYGPLRFRSVFNYSVKKE